MPKKNKKKPSLSDKPWFSGSFTEGQNPEPAPAEEPSASPPWFRASSPAGPPKPWSRLRDHLEKGQLRSDVVTEAPDAHEATGQDANVVLLQQHNTEKNRAAVNVAAPTDVRAEHIMTPLLEAGPLRHVDISSEDSFRLAEQFIRDGRVGRCIRVHLQDDQTRRVELLADSDTAKAVVLTTGIVAMIFHISSSPESASVHWVALLSACIFFAFTGIKLAAFGTFYLRGKPWQRTEVLLVTTHLAIVIVKFAQHNAGGKINSGWYQLMLPAIMVCWSRTMRHTLNVVQRTFVASSSAILFMCFVLAIFGYFGFVLFEFTYDDAYTDSGVDQDRYDNLFYAFVSSFCLLTTENYPSIQVTAYEKHTAALLYFMPFIFVTIVLQAVVLARVDTAFTQALLNQTRYHFSKELRGYAFAFLAITLPEQAHRDKLLHQHRELHSPTMTPKEDDSDGHSLSDSDGSTSRPSSPACAAAPAPVGTPPGMVPEPTISADQWLRLVRFFTDSEEKAKAFAEVTFFFRDDDASGDISLMEFLGLAELLKFEITEEVDMLRGRHSGLLNPGWGVFRGCTDTASFVTASSINLVAAALVMMQPSFVTHHQHSSGDGGEPAKGRLSDGGMAAVAVVLLVLFLGEIALRILSRGFRAHVRSFFDLFEGAIFLASCVGLAALGWRGASLLVLRLFCLFRWSLWRPQRSVLWYLDRGMLACTGTSLRTHIYHLMLHIRSSMQRAISLFVFTGGLLFLIQYFFSILGNMIIEDDLAAVNLNPNAPMHGQYGDMTNFSTVGAAMIAMFQVMLTNNWNDILYSSMTGTGPGIAIFFIVYYVLVPLLFLNIFTSIVLQSFKAEEGTETQAPGAIVVDMGGKLYRLERKGYRRGLELHMDLVDNTKQELMQDIIEGGVFETTVMNGLEQDLLQEKKALAVLQLRHQKQKELEKHERDFKLAAMRDAFDEVPEGLQTRARSDTVARDRGVRTQFGHLSHEPIPRPAVQPHSSAQPAPGGLARARSNTAVELTPMSAAELQGLRASHEGWAQEEPEVQRQIRRVTRGPARVHKSVLESHTAPTRGRTHSVAGSHDGVEMTSM